MSRKFNNQTLTALAMSMALAATAVCGSAKSNDYDREADKRKADYIFLEALKYNNEESKDAFYELIERSYELNPEDKYVGMQYGCKLLVEEGDSASVYKGLGLIDDYVKTEPGDLYTGVMYASLADHLGRTEEAIRSMEATHKANPERTDVTLKYLDLLISNADSVTGFDKALALIDALERSEGIIPDLSMRRMRIFESQGDTVAIKGEMQKLLKSSPNRPEYNIFAGQLYLGLGDKDSARIYFDRAVEIDPTNGAAYYNRAAFFNQIGDSVAYDKEVFQAMKQPDLDIEPKLEILKEYVIKLFRDSTQTERLTGLFKDLVDRYPHEPQVRNLFSDYLLAIEDYAGAAEQKSYELDLVPGDERKWIVLASLYLQSGQFDKSSEASNRGLHYFPEATALYEIGSAAELNLDHTVEALDFIDRGLAKVDSTDTESLSRLISSKGDILYKEEKLDSAFALYNEAIAIDPGNLTALNNCAYYMACADKDLDVALEMIEKVMAERNDDPTSLDTYAWVLFKRKEYDKAREAIDNAIANSQEASSDLFDHAGDIYFMDGEPDQALDFWKKALVLDPENQLLKRKVKHKTFFYK